MTVKETTGVYGSVCFICENGEDLKSFRGKFICRDCITVARSM